MAKAREIPGLTTDLPYGETAARVLEVRSRELVEHSAGVLDMSDIERVHAMRVATRRLRAAIEIFRPCFPKDRGKATLKQVKELADALGERRDRDVAIDSLDRFAAAMPAPDRPGIQSLVARFREEQAAANVALEPFVDPDRVHRIRESVLALAEAARESAGAFEELEVAPEPEAEPATELAKPPAIEPTPSEDPHDVVVAVPFSSRVAADTTEADDAHSPNGTEPEDAS